jgi:GGDEF domain-containing protein
MSQGPIVVVADRPAAAVAATLARVGLSPVVEASWHDAVATIARVEPAAVVLADHSHSSENKLVGDLETALLMARGPLIPTLALLEANDVPMLPYAVPVRAAAMEAVLPARLRAALRVRTLHAAVIRRIDALVSAGIAVPALPHGDPLEDVSVLVAGRGRGYPALTVAIGERMGLIGALSLELARDTLEARDIDGIVIGEGFNRSVVEGFLADLGSDPRWRDLPIVAPADCVRTDPERLPNLDPLHAEPAQVAAHILPLARLHAYAARLKRMAASLDRNGIADPHTGLLLQSAFATTLARAIADAAARGSALSIARISLDDASRRASLDAARIASRLVRTADFACRDEDGAVLIVFTETDLASAHAVARRIASVLKHTTLAPGGERGRFDPTVALATLRPRDTVESLIARVAPGALVAAE